MSFDKPRYEKLRFSAYTPHIYEKLCEKQVKDLLDAGIDFPIVGFDSFFSMPQEKRTELLEFYHKYGMECIIYDHSIQTGYEINGDATCMLFDKDKAASADWYRDYPAFAGNSFVDEPGTIHMKRLGETVEDYKKLFPGKVPYINLLPMYANDAQLTAGAWMADIEYYKTAKTSFQFYLDEYIKYVDTDYICLDIYPCHNNDGLKTTYEDYVRSIEITADACRKSNREFWVCVQSCSWGPWVRVPDEPDFRWQMYTMLSFGVTAFFYYVFASRPKHDGTPFDENGNKTDLWFISKRITSELNKFSKLFMTYKNIGAYNINCTEKTPYLAMDNPCKPICAIKDIKTASPLLVGCFEKREGSGQAFTLVNMTDPMYPAPAEVKFKLEGAATAYVSGDPIALTPDADGYCTLILAMGDGIFITVN